MPGPLKSNSRLEQVEALNIVRSHAIQANEQEFLSHNAIREQVEATIASSGIMMAAVHHISVNNTSVGYDMFHSDPSS